MDFPNPYKIVTAKKLHQIPNLIGRKFSKLLVLKFIGCTIVGKTQKKKGSVWFCKCDCGNTKYILSHTLVHTSTKSCGCWQKQIARERLGNQKGINNIAYKHGKSKDKEFQRIKAVIRKFNITEVEYYSLLKQQNNCCAICQQSVNTFKKFLSVDHNHITGKVRGLLCGACNIGLGMFKDSPEKLEKAKAYLNSWNLLQNKNLEQFENVGFKVG